VLGEPQMLGIESLGDNSVKIRSTLKTAPSKHWDAGRIVRRRIKSEFDRLGIAIPFQQNVAWRIPTQEKALNSTQPRATEDGSAVGSGLRADRRE